MMTPHPWRPKQDPWAAADYDDPVVLAVRALKRGEASMAQQLLCWAHLEYMGGTGDAWQDMVYRPGPTSRDTDFASGKQYSMLQWKKFLRPEYNPKGKPVDGEGKKPRRRRAASGVPQ